MQKPTAEHVLKSANVDPPAVRAKQLEDCDIQHLQILQHHWVFSQLHSVVYLFTLVKFVSKSCSLNSVFMVVVSQLIAMRWVRKSVHCLQCVLL